MESPLVVVFLAVIALTALLQAGFVAALAFGARMGGRKLDEMEEQFEASIVPRIRKAAKLTDKAAELSERSLAQVRRVDSLLAQASRRAERHMESAAMRLEGAVERTALRVDSAIAERTARAREHPLLRKLAGAAALIRGLQRALEVWQASAAAVEEEEYDEEMSPDGGSPPDPSPA